MPESEFDVIRRELHVLLARQEKMHDANHETQDKDRAAFSRAMDQQRDQFQAAINLIVLDQKSAREQALRNGIMLEQIVGEGSDPESGRLGRLEKGMEVMKQFRWQALALGVGALWVLDRLFKH